MEKATKEDAELLLRSFQATSTPENTEATNWFTGEFEPQKNVWKSGLR